MGLAILLMVVRSERVECSAIARCLSMPLSLLQYAVSWPVQMIDKLGNIVSTHDELVKENLNLKIRSISAQSTSATPARDRIRK